MPPGDDPFSFFTICFCAAGWQTWYVDDHYFYLSPGHFLYIKPGEFLSLADKWGPKSLVYLLQFKLPKGPGDFLGFTEEERKGMFFLLNEFRSPLIRPEEGKEYLMDRIFKGSLELARGGGEVPVLSYIRVRNELRELFLLLAEGKNVLTNALDCLIDSLLPLLPPGGYTPLVKKAIKNMNGNLYDGLTLVSLAEDVNISMSRFKALFKEETGLTPLDYYTRLSIRKSLELLHDSQVSIKSIASGLGFSSPRYFTSVFKKTVGMTPEEFRNWSGRYL